MADNKKQHYVPQLYLRKFSTDSKTIAIFSLKENRILTQNGPIDGQCYKNYLYGKDLKFEKSLSTLEGITQSIFKEILRKKLPKRKTEEYVTFLIYVLYQSARTIFAVDQLNEMIDKMFKNIIKDDLRIKGNREFTEEDLEKAKIFVNNAPNFNLGIIAQMIPLALDLECRLLINKTDENFITTDNPVLFYNKYYYDELRSYTGIACKGLIVGFPVTPKHYVILYDSKIYKIKKNYFKDYFSITNKADIYELNKLHAATANKTLYFLDAEEKYLQQIASDAKKIKPIEKNILRESDIKEDLDGKKSKIIMTSKASIKYNAELSFLKIKNNIPQDYLDQSLARDPFLVELHSEFLKKIDEKKYKPSQWGDFLKDKEAGKVK